jgi:hypothetical protein
MLFFCDRVLTYTKIVLNEITRMLTHCVYKITQLIYEWVVKNPSISFSSIVPTMRSTIIINRRIVNFAVTQAPLGNLYFWWHL